MKTFYTIDRCGEFHPGLKLCLQSHLVDPGPFRDHIEMLYPSGLSKHGMCYISNSESRFECGDGAIELYFEEVRRSSYKDRPSRNVSMFCCESLEDIAKMRNALSAPSSPVFEVLVYGRWHQANMGLLNSTGTALALSQRAHAYWRGEEGLTGKNPLWEVIAELPVEIGRKIE